jgi:hypothetical protein
MSDPAINPGVAPPRDPVAPAPVQTAAVPVAMLDVPTMARDTVSYNGTMAAMKTVDKAKPDFAFINPPADPPRSAEKDPGSAQPKDDSGWKVRFYMGMNATNYHNSDVKIRSDHLNVDIKDMAWHERKSDSYYNPLTWTSAQNALQWIDEPSNTFVFTAQKNKNEFMLSMFHPKYLMESDQQKEVHGTVDGVRVDGVRPLNGPLDGISPQPGDMSLSEMKNTHRQFEFELGYGREFTLFRTSNNSSLVYRPAVYAGVMAGHAVSSYGDSGHWDDQYKVQGVVASIGNKLEFRYKDRVSVFTEYKISGARLNQGVLGGTATYGMVYTPLTFGIGIKLFDQDNHRR